jgi:hypothetical protein
MLLVHIAGKRWQKEGRFAAAAAADVEKLLPEAPP